MSGCKVTLHVMPDYVEYIVKLDHGYYGVVNLMSEGKDKVSLLFYWGDYFKRLQNIHNKDKVMDILVKHCPTLVRHHHPSARVGGWGKIIKLPT